MAHLKDAKGRAQFIARCKELHIAAEEMEQNFAAPLTTQAKPKRPGHYEAINASFERQREQLIAPEPLSPRSFSRCVNETSEPPSIAKAASSFSTPKPATPNPAHVDNMSKAPSISGEIPSSMQKVAAPDLAALLRKQAFAECHQELAACYTKLAALHALEAAGVFETNAQDNPR